jgi:hypothetical protein
MNRYNVAPLILVVGLAVLLVALCFIPTTTAAPKTADLFVAWFFATRG